MTTPSREPEMPRLVTPYRETEIPRLVKRIWWRKIVGLGYLVIVLLGMLGGAREFYLYLKAHPSPKPPTEEDERKGSEREAILALRAIFPGKELSVHCAYRENRTADGCAYRSVFSCLSFIGNHKVEFVCESGSVWHGCSAFEFTAMTSVPGGAP